MPESNRYYLAKAPIWRALLHLCIPMIAGLSVGAIYNVVNAGFVGSLHSTALLAAITFSVPVFALQMAVGGVFGVGGGTYISRLLGTEEDGPLAADAAQRVKRVSAFTVWGSIGAGVVVGGVALLFLDQIVALLGATGDTAAPTATYGAIMLAFSPVLVGAFAIEQVVRAEGAAVVSMVGLIASTITNLALDVLFILGLGWGVAGAALAIGLSNVVMVGYYAWWLHFRSSASTISPRWFTIDVPMLRAVFGVGASELIMSSFLIVSSLMFNRVAVAYGDAPVAAVGVALRISQLVEMVCMGVFLGAIPVFAFAFGARNHTRLASAIRASAIAIAVITVAGSTIAFVFHEQVLGLFTSDPAVLSDGGLILTAMLVSTIFNGFTGLLIAVFQATEQVRNATIMSFAQGLLFVPVLFGLNALFGLNGLVWSATVAELMTFGLAVVLFVTSRNALTPPLPSESPSDLTAAVGSATAAVD